MKNLLILCFILFGSLPILAQTTASQNIAPVTVGVVGIVQGATHLNAKSQTNDQIRFEELELNIQGKVYPDVDATLIVSVHPEDGEFGASIENGFLEFSGIGDGLGATIGRQFVPFGKQNKLHPEQQSMIDRPAVISQFMGDENVIADGLSLGYILPLPFFSRLEVGHWKNTLSGTPSTLPFSPTGYLSTARLWSSIEVSDDTELELGLSAIQGFGPQYATHRDDATVVGTDLTLRRFLGSKSRIMIQSEVLQLNRNVSDSAFSRTGGFLLANYRSETGWEVGLRYDHTQLASVDGGNAVRDIAINVMQKFSETYFGRIEYVHNLVTNDPAIYGQIVFNLGSHNHAFQ